MFSDNKDRQNALNEEEKDISLEEEQIEEVSGGIKWGSGERPTLKDAQANDRKRRK